MFKMAILLDDQSSVYKYKYLKKSYIQYQSQFKTGVVCDKEKGMATAEVLQKYSYFALDKSKISCWFKQKDTILKDAVVEAKNMFKVMSQKKYNISFKEMSILFLEAREKRHETDFNWLWRNAMIIYCQQLDDPFPTVRKYVLVNLI